jgi:PAS domain S-box-containing protein
MNSSGRGPTSMGNGSPGDPADGVHGETTGGMAARVAAFDWCRTPLGPIDQWPKGLRALVDLLLAHPVPAILLWGPDLTQVYNDGWAVIAGAKHPRALGQPNHDCWPELRRYNEPIYERVLTRGESVLLTDQPIPLDRRGRGTLEEAYFTVSYSPCRDDKGRIAGIFVTVSETTDKVLAERDRERWRAEAARREALTYVEQRAQLLDTALTHINDFAYIFDRDGRFLYGNRPLLELWGLTLEQVVGKNFLDLGYPEAQAAKLQREIQQVIDSKRSLIGESQYTNPKGVTGFYEYIFNPVVNADGEVEVVTGSTREITERHRTDAARRNAESRYLELFNTIHQGFCTLELAFDEHGRPVDYRFLEVSPSFEAQTGIPNAAGRWMREIAPEHDQHWFDLYGQVAMTGEPASFEQHSTPLRRWWSVFAYRTGDPAERRVAVLFHDITDRRRAEEALRQSEERYRRLIETANEGIWTIDADGRTTYVNQRMADLLGYAPEEMIGRVHTDFMWEQDRPTGDADMELRRQGTAAVWDQRYRRKDGSELWTVASCNSLHDATGRFVGALGMFTDITARKRAEEELRLAKEQAEHANRAKDRFLAVLSHELRTPLTPVAMVTTAMEMDPRLPFEFRDDVAMIRRNVELETRLIDDLLDLNRVVSGKLRLTAQPTHLHRVVEHVLETVGSELHEKQLQVELALGARNDLVSADPARLQQVLWNLLKNAGKFTPKGGRVTVRTRDEGGGVVLDVTDNGQGIKSELLPRIFDPFEQGGDEVTRRHGGMGLGLAIAKAVVDLHGGTLAAASDGEGRGATFTVTFPTLEAPPDAAPVAAERLPHASARVVRLLLVEDHPDTSKTLARLLRLDGFDVRCAGTVAAAEALATSETFDVIVSDLGLPDGSGHDLMRRLRAMSPLPGIAMSGYGMDEDIRQSQEAGFAEHFVKPVDVTQLRAAIRRLSNRQALPE